MSYLVLSLEVIVMFSFDKNERIKLLITSMKQCLKNKFLRKTIQKVYIAMKFMQLYKYIYTRVTISTLTGIVK
jgi:hypothetical protein